MGTRVAMLQRVDQSELLTALHSAEGPTPFALFLDRLRRRLGAREVVLAERSERGGWLTRPDGAEQTLKGARAHREALLRMRPGRVYTLGEAIPELGESGMAVRAASASGDQWLIAVDGDRHCGASASALLAGLAPHVGIACENRARLDAAHSNLAAAGAALERGGIGWALVSRTGEPVAGAQPPATRRQLATLATALDEGARQVSTGTVVALPPPACEGDDKAAALVLFRLAAEPSDRATAFAAEHDVLPSEARLAIALTEGLSMADAAARLGITLETARTYSKRLYARTGARGQADLVRLAWTGLTALA